MRGIRPDLSCSMPLALASRGALHVSATPQDASAQPRTAPGVASAPGNEGNATVAARRLLPALAAGLPLGVVDAEALENELAADRCVMTAQVLLREQIAGAPLMIASRGELPPAPPALSLQAVP